MVQTIRFQAHKECFFSRAFHDFVAASTGTKGGSLAKSNHASVRRIQRQYEARGLVIKITSHSSVSGGVIVNEVQRDYSPFGLLVSDWQSHGGAVVTSGGSVTPRVLYAYTNGSGDKLRRTSVTYPNTTRVLNLEYGAANTIDDHLGRIATLDIAGTNIAAYTYCGANWQVEVNYPAANLELTFKQQTGDPTGDAGDIYTGYDRFGRAIDLRWRVASTNAHLERVQYGFDRADRRQWRRRVGVATPFPVFPDLTAEGEGDRYYRYDALGQVLAEDFGDLNLAQSAVAGIPNAGGRWSYDPTGNIGSAQDVIAMTGTERMVRTYDKGNRITASGDGAEPILTDRAGRITRLRGSGLPNHDLKWDAWGRLVAVIPTGNSIPLGSYTYDGLHRRVKRSTIDGVIWNVFYNDAWKPIEERRASHPTQAAIQYFWGARHRDDLIRRDRAATAGGALSEVRHVLMDYFSPLAITNGATITERYAFGAFGRRSILNAAGSAVIASSTVAWEFGFHGQFRDNETGLYNYGYRHYAPALGRFLSKDPIMEAGGNNLYRMAGNSAVNRVDLLGLAEHPLGPMLEEKHKGSNCAGFSLFPKHVLDDNPAKINASPEQMTRKRGEKDKEGNPGGGCRKVGAATDCKREAPDCEQHVILYLPSDQNWTDPKPDFHVIGEVGCSTPGYYYHQTGADGDIRGPFEMPNEKASNYYKMRAGKDVPLKQEQFCCPSE
jgi:RHS repeat-associated protein